MLENLFQHQDNLTNIIKKTNDFTYFV